ncbi:hypothetical protein CBW65_23380 [Tumebacillus avium]|uniref:Carrier domain-containing protein n=1 Tax=Tumebacillus avium TaxID=1903704 RepID=A0A1Y0ISP0_9BACL|nr:non-ribosomal peptide synthetase [Tumebacillus avium]ARU63628.1 hypothetical protein CBW65_23380 [Tumebacillus avium]
MKRENIESLYELTPLQHGMLFHTLYAPESGVYGVQLNMLLEGRLNIDAFSRAFQKVMERHPILRTAFYWEDLEKPLQVVGKVVELPLRELDWSAVLQGEQQEKLAAFYEQDRIEPFVFTQAPVMRITMIKLADELHSLTWSFHHLLLDGWSLQMVLQELWQFYEAYQAGVELTLQPARPFRDYLAWLQRQDMEAAERYWRQALAGFAEPTALPLYWGPREIAAGEAPYGALDLNLPHEVHQKLQKVARNFQITLNTLLQGIWALYLSRASGEEDVVFGSTVSGRPGDLPGVDTMAGMLINTLPVRVGVDLSRELGPWLKELQNEQLEARQYDHSPLISVQEWSEVPRSLRLFETIFVFENFHDEEETEAAKRSLNIIEVSSEQQTSFPLTLVGIPAKELILRLQYDAQFYDAESVRRMLDHLSVMLHTVADQPDVSLAEIPLLSTAEREEVLTVWNATDVDFPRDRFLHQYVEAHAAHAPDAPAVVTPDGVWTYGELNAYANRLARFLQKQGAGPERKVGVCLERSPELIGAYLAAWKTGAAFLMIDPKYPAERIRFMLDDAQAVVLLTQGSLQERTVWEGGASCRLDLDQAVFADESAENLPAVSELRHLACVLYTSGSTGTPKGVELEHESILNFAHWYARYTGLTSADRTSHISGLGFDGSLMDLCPALLIGCAIVQPEDEVRYAPQKLQAWLLEQEIAVSYTTTVLTEALMALEWPSDTKLRMQLAGGEAMRSYPRPGLPFRVINGYGPSEATIYTTTYEVPTAPADGRLPSIGRPLANMKTFVLDDHLNPLPVGMPGELYAGGIGLGRGYLNRQELTAEKFLDTEFGRLYKTGDKVRWLPDGNLEYFGRLDQLVKIRGFRIELGEIEAGLLKHPEIKEAAVLVQEQQILAYVAGRQVPSPKELRAFLQQGLPEFMLPSYFVELEALPLTANGKVNRRALPAPSREHAAGAEVAVGARTDTERELLEIWQKVLRLDGIGVTDNFFAIGGHSLLATQVTGQVAAKCGVEISLRALFESPTIEALARLIDKRKGIVSEIITIRPADRSKRFPLSFAQERLWFLEQFNSNPAAYNVPMALRMSGRLDVPALQQSFNEIMARHEAMRTSFAVVDGQPEQVIAARQEMPFELVDLSDSPVELAVMQAALEAIQEGDTPFDLTHGALVRTKLLRIAAEDHVLLLTMHHIISDGWSMRILIDELSKLYAAFQQGAPSPLAPLAMQYVDFAQWQRDWLQGEVLETQLAYWKAALRGAPSVLQLPTDRPRPAVQTFAGASRDVVLPAGLIERLKALGQQEGVTLFMTLLTAFSVLLSRTSGQEDIVVGSPIAGRTRPETHGLIGFFVNTLALRTDLSGAPSYRELLKRVREVTLGAYAHQDLPFERLVQELRPERNTSYTALFQVMFALQNAPGEDLSLPGLTWSDFPIELGKSKFDLSLLLQEENGGVAGSVVYNTDLFDDQTIERFIERFALLLEGIVNAPDRAVAEMPLLTEEERGLIAAWNDTAAPFSEDLCVHQLFERQADQTPDLVAIEYGERTLTYRELNEQANRLAHHLQKRGVGPEQLVAIAVERGPEMIVGLLGVLKAGGAYVPVDPAYPAERIAYQLEDGGVQVLLTQSHLADELPHCGAEVILLDQQTFPEEPVRNPQSGVRSGNLAYVIHTSGSTGKPKGVLIEHRSLMNFTEMFIRNFGLQEGTRCTMFPSFSFDSSVKDLYPPLATGSTIVLFKREDLLPGPHLQSLLREKRVNRISTTPAMLAQLPSADLPDLDTVICGGTVLPLEVVQRWKQDGRQVINVYGPTETTVFVTAEVCDGVSVPTIGAPLQNSVMHVLDANMRPVPIGVTGELHIGGAGLARGYLNRPELTAEKFVETPFGRLYKTGDAVRWLPNGKLEFLGRIDLQVKVRGYRIELGEIEAVLRQHPAVQDAVVLAWPDESGENQLVGYLAVGKQEAPASADMRAYLKAALPEFMVPGQFVMMEALPLTVNRKVDRTALPEPDRSQAVRAEEAILPRTPLEETVAGVWRRVLRLPLVGVRENFFELGGHSLLATQVMSHLNSALGVEVPLRALFESPTIESLSAYVEHKMREEWTSAALPIVPVPRTGSLPLSFAQERLWFFEQFHQGTSTYNMPFALRLKGHLHLSALQRALDEILRRHEVLRTAFHSPNGEPSQVVADAELPFAVQDLSGLADFEREMQALLTVIEEGDRPFDLSRGPMLRALLLRMGETDHVLLVTMHHIASDGWSMSILIEELSVLYEAFSQDRPSPLAPLAVQYADFAAWQRAWFQGGVLEEQLAYWKQQLRGADFVLELPADKPRPAVQAFNGAMIEVSLANGVLPRLKALSQQEGVTLYMTLLAAFNALLCRLSGQEDIVVGSPIAGRTRQETEALIGFFVNTLALRTDLSGNPGFRELLSRVRETTLGAYAHQDLPFERLVREVQPERDMSYSALFQVMFALQNAPQGDLELPGLTLTRFPIDKATSMFDLTFSLYEGEDGLVGVVQYNTDLFEAETVQRIAERFDVLLAGIASAPDCALAELPVLTDEERGLLANWRETAAPYSDRASLHQLIEAQAARTPDAVAAECAEGVLTYRELNEQANRIARVLQAKGVGPDQLVAIAVDRTPEMAVAALAVLKAGGAYVPLDPAYPSDRLAFMLEDSQAKWLLTKGHLAAGLPDSQADVVLLDADWSGISAEPVPSQAGPDDLAYVIYTSGSTGRPKGTLLMHRGAVNFVEDCVRRFGWTTGDRVLKTASFSFDASVCDLLVPLAAGATVCFAEQTLPGPEMIRLLRDWKITGLFLSSSALAILPDEDLPQLRTIFTGGEVVTEELMARYGEGRDLFVFYGPTEASVGVAAMKAGPGGRTGAMGYPLQNTKLYVLDASLQEVPIGVPGEVHVAGIGLARGYLNQPELTAEKFIVVNEERLYKTGDLARWLPDGKLEFCGRIDEQVKLRGFRVELGEIEAQLRKHPTVQDAAVILREDVLVGYVAAESVSLSVLREHLAEQLPEYMVPSALVVLEALPLTPNGKVDRRALPVPAVSHEHDFVAPRDAVELMVSRIFEELLGVSKVGAKENFFTLGGHSLLAVRLSAQIQQKFGQELPLARLFQHATVEGVAHLLRQGGQTAYTPLIELAKGEGDPFFCVHAVGGSALSYLELANALGGGQPFYAFQARGLEVTEAPFEDIQTMAACYVAELVKVQPQGPVHIGGWSFGGAVAYEMVRLLQAQGREVASLVLIDSYAPTLFIEEPDALLPSFAADLAGQLGVLLLPEEAEELSRLDEQAGLVFLHSHVATDLGYEQLTRLFTVFKANMTALVAYLPAGMVSVPTTLYLSESSAGNPHAPTLGWEELLQRVEVKSVEGDHFTILKNLQHI